MYIVRFIAGILALCGAYGVASVFELDVRDVMTLIAFLLIVDKLTVEYIAYMYMKSVMANLAPSEKDKNNDDSSSN